jgi:hypothetical protein
MAVSPGDGLYRPERDTETRRSRSCVLLPVPAERNDDPGCGETTADETCDVPAQRKPETTSSPKDELLSQGKLWPLVRPKAGKKDVLHDPERLPPFRVVEPRSLRDGQVEDRPLSRSDRVDDGILGSEMRSAPPVGGP